MVAGQTITTTITTVGETPTPTTITIMDGAMTTDGETMTTITTMAGEIKVVIKGEEVCGVARSMDFNGFLKCKNTKETLRPLISMTSLNLSKIKLS